MLKEIDVEAALANCRALINQINAGLSAEEPFVDASSATELLFCLERAASALKKIRSTPVRERGETKIAFNYRPLTAPRLRALHRAEHIGSALKRGVNVCQRQLVNEVFGPLVTEFVPNFGCEGATPIQRGSNASLLGRVQALKLTHQT